MANKRKHRRMNCLVPIESKKGGAFDMTQTIDISKKGLGFVSSKRIPVNKKIPIEIDLSEESSVLIIGKVKWSRAIKGTELFRIGLNFESLEKGAQTRLNQFFKQSEVI